MTLLATTQQVLTWLGIVPTDESVGKWKKLFYTGLSSSILVVIVSHVIASAIFFWKFHSMDLEVSLYTFYQVASWTSAVYIFVAAFVLRQQFIAIFVGLSDIYRASKIFNYFSKQVSVALW